MDKGGGGIKSTNFLKLMHHEFQRFNSKECWNYLENSKEKLDVFSDFYHK